MKHQIPFDNLWSKLPQCPMSLSPNSDIHGPTWCDSQLLLRSEALLLFLLGDLIPAAMFMIWQLSWLLHPSCSLRPTGLFSGLTRCCLLKRLSQYDIIYSPTWIITSFFFPTFSLYLSKPDIIHFKSFSVIYVPLLGVKLLVCSCFLFVKSQIFSKSSMNKWLYSEVIKMNL